MNIHGSRSARRTAISAAALAPCAMVVFLIVVGTAHAQAACNDNNFCEPGLGEFDAVTGFQCADCFCGNGTCDTPTGLEHFTPELQAVLRETFTNCPADCAPYAPNYGPGPGGLSPQGGTPQGGGEGEAGTCPASHPSCGTGLTASCPDGQVVEWSDSGVMCAVPHSGRCFKCSDGDDEPPPVQCNESCETSADCTGPMRCSMDQSKNPPVPLCFFHERSKLCVKKCIVPTCIENVCEYATPTEGPAAPYVVCEGVTSCPAEKCGDGIVQNFGPDGISQGGEGDDEQCDDGNNVGEDGCSPTCKKEVCGDSIVQPKGEDGLPNTADDEECDDGDRSTAQDPHSTLGDGCDYDCKKEICGNGKRDYGETCDDGPLNSDTIPNRCRTNCERFHCGDGIIDTAGGVQPYGESCDCGPGNGWDTVDPDDPATAYCETTGPDGQPAICHKGICMISYCGDGFAFNAGLDRESGTADDEMCDMGSLNTNNPIGDNKCQGGSCTTCQTHLQCGTGMMCVDGNCVQKTCAEDSECNGGKCIMPVSENGVPFGTGMCKAGGCMFDSECGFGTCENGSCSACHGDNECQSGECQNGTCREQGCTSDDMCNPTCRLDCKMARCGDGIVDEGAGETCDEGEAMWACLATPHPSCSCAVPTWGSQEGHNKEFKYDCCEDGSECVVWATDSCPHGCGVGPEFLNTCNNGRLEENEECDITDYQSLFAYRANRDATNLPFLVDNGQWEVTKLQDKQWIDATGRKYVAVDPRPNPILPPDAIRSQGIQGSPLTYFHLWDVIARTDTEKQNIAQSIMVEAMIDFHESGKDFLPHTIFLTPTLGATIRLADISAAILVLRGSEVRSEIRIELVDPTDGDVLAAGAFTSVRRSTTPIYFDALQIVATTSTPATDTIGCRADCILNRCGNGDIDAITSEQCDDGNVESEDGCTDRCELEICALP